MVLHRIGTEHEKFGFELGTLRLMKYEQIAVLLNGIAERFDWEKIMEGDNIIGLKQVNWLFYLSSFPFMEDHICIPSCLHLVLICVVCMSLNGNAQHFIGGGNSVIIFSMACAAPATNTN